MGIYSIEISTWSESDTKTLLRCSGGGISEYFQRKIIKRSNLSLIDLVLDLILDAEMKNEWISDLPQFR